jgi:glycosyltransferase involved in cell wall biosynthesis
MTDVAQAGFSTNSTPTVSVVTIFLNGERYLAAAVDSVLAQSWEDFELLLVDDGSSDGSTGLAKGYADRDPRVRYLEHPGHVNRGMSASRNRGIDAARGTFLAFIDADDVWRPEKLGEQLAIMRRHPELGMVCGAVNYWRSWAGELDETVPTGHISNVVVHPPETSLALYPLGKAAAPCPSDLLLRLDAVRAVGQFEEHFSGPRQMYEDQGFLAKLYLAYPVYFSDQVWLDYRQHPESCVAVVTRDGQYDHVRSYFLTWFRGYLMRKPDPPPMVLRAVDRALRPYRFPRLARLVRTAAEFAERLAAAGLRFGRRMKRLGHRSARRR